MIERTFIEQAQICENARKIQILFYFILRSDILEFFRYFMYHINQFNFLFIESPACWPVWLIFKVLFQICRQK